MSDIVVIGSGTWGTALAILLHDNGHNVTIWSAIESEVNLINEHRSHKSLPGISIPENMKATTDLKSAMDKKDLLILSVPSVYVRETAHKMAAHLVKGQIVVNVAKGIEETSLLTLSQVVEEELVTGNVAVLSGPSHAEEVSRGLPTTCVVGAHDKQTAEYIQNTFMSSAFRVYTSPDILGIEIGASLKNVIALAAGIADGLGYGDNTKAALITRGIAEIARLGLAMGGKMQTFSGLSGIGDLIVTCASMHSRNRRAGILIGEGCSMEEAMAKVEMVVEGVYSAKAALELAKKYNVDMPIIQEVNEVLFLKKDPAEAVLDLMLRDKTLEHSDLPWN